ncbi:MAG: hypothetical protein IJ088_11470 [Clostridia bacterium]|nr:hypothetical protein [Clostridia bacterium]
MDRDISAILIRIRDNIRRVESGETEQPVMDEIDTDFHRMMELIRLFLLSERDTYYGFILMNLTFRATFSGNEIAGIVLREFPPVFESNPLLLCKFPLKEILYIVCHEIDHIVFNHPSEMVRLGQDDADLMLKFNFAADAAVNDRLNDEIKRRNSKYIREPDGGITSDVLAEMFDLGKVARSENYRYYFERIRNKPIPDEWKQNQPERMMEKKKEAGNGTPDTGGHANDPEVVTADRVDSLADHDWETDGDAENTAALVRELINAAVDMMNDEARGLMPGEFMSQVEQINRPPKLTWQQILKRYVGTISADKRRTRTRLNRRQPARFDLSGRMDDKVLKIVVVMDTSASVSDEMIGQIISEIFEILARRKHEVTVIESDARVRRAYRIAKPADVQKKVSGRGGTSFTPAIEYINHDRYFRDALMIYFTDGFGETDIPRPRTYRNIWVVFDRAENLSVKEPYGVVIALEKQG